MTRALQKGVRTQEQHDIHKYILAIFSMNVETNFTFKKKSFYLLNYYFYSIPVQTTFYEQIYP